MAARVEADATPLEAARWIAAAEAAYADQRWTWEPLEIRVRDDAVATIRARLSDAQWRAAYDAGRAAGLDRAIGVALSGERKYETIVT